MIAPRVTPYNISDPDAITLDWSRELVVYLKRLLLGVVRAGANEHMRRRFLHMLRLAKKWRMVKHMEYYEIGGEG